MKPLADDFGTLLNRYKVFQSEVHNIGGKNYSLDQMEKGQFLGAAFKKKGWNIKYDWNLNTPKTSRQSTHTELSYLACSVIAQG